MAKKKATYANSDFTAMLLPHNRKAQFKFIFKTRKGLIVSLGLLLTLFAIPLIVSLVLKDFYVFRVYAAISSEEITDELLAEFFLFVQQNHLVFSLIGTAAYLIFTIGLAGVFQIYKKLAFGEPIFFWHDFKKGISNNIKPFLLISFLLLVVDLTISLLFYFFGLSILVIIVFFVFLILVVPIIINMYFYVSVYNAKIGQIFKSGLQLFAYSNIKGILLTLGLLIIPLLFNFLAEFLSITPAINLFVMIIYFIFLLPIILLGAFLFYYSILDENINKTNFPNKYRLGLYNPDSIDKKEKTNEGQMQKSPYRSKRK